MHGMWQVELKLRSEYSEAELQQQSAANRRAWVTSGETDGLYPYGITWSAPTWMAVVRDTDGRIVGAGSLLARTILWGGEPVLVGGISGVATDPDYGGRGVASAALASLVRHMCEELHVVAGLLLASKMGVPRYTHLGWQIVDGPLVCAQPDGPLNWTTTYPEMPGMAWSCRPELPRGPIDLQGLPW
jgi:hypothetical protein